MRALLLGGGLLALGGVAHAGVPNPDRPSVSRSGARIAPGTAELELGVGLGSASTGVSAGVPFTLKAAPPKLFEFRVSGDVVGAASGSPGLVFASKIELVEEDKVDVALYLDSALPLGAETWSSNVHALGTFVAGPVGLQANVGVTVGPGSGFSGAPVAFAVAPPAPGRASWFVEYAGVVGNGVSGHTLTGGAGMLVTSNFALDVGVSYLADDRALAATVGGTMNFGGRP